MPKSYRHPRSLSVQATWTSAFQEWLIPSIEEKLGVRSGIITSDDIGGLWKLCQQELALLDEANLACSLFSVNVSLHYNIAKLHKRNKLSCHDENHNFAAQ